MLARHVVQAEVAYERDDFIGASRLAAQVIEPLHKAKPQGSFQRLARAYLLYYSSSIYGRAEYQLGHFAAATSAERAALEQRKSMSSITFSVLSDKRAEAQVSTWLSMALARQGTLREAAQVIGPVVSFEQSLLARDHGDVWIPYELACALYAQSLTEPTERETLLRRAATLLNGLPPRLQRVHDVRQWRRRVSQPPAQSRAS